MPPAPSIGSRAKTLSGGPTPALRGLPLCLNSRLDITCVMALPVAIAPCWGQLDRVQDRFRWSLNNLTTRTRIKRAPRRTTRPGKPSRLHPGSCPPRRGSIGETTAPLAGARLVLDPRLRPPDNETRSPRLQLKKATSPRFGDCPET